MTHRKINRKTILLKQDGGAMIKGMVDELPAPKIKK
jgi:hypothetical protein